MTMPLRKYVRTPDGRVVVVPTPAPPPEKVEEEERDGVSDLFEGPKKDDVSDLVEVSEETEVSAEDVIGGEEENPELTEEDEDYLFGVLEVDVVGEPPKPPKPKFRRTIKRYPPPPTTLGGMR